MQAEVGYRLSPVVPIAELLNSKFEALQANSNKISINKTPQPLIAAGFIAGAEGGTRTHDLKTAI